MSPVSFCRKAAARSATARISASTASKLLRPIGKAGDHFDQAGGERRVQRRRAAAAGNGVARGGPGEIVRDGKVSS